MLKPMLAVSATLDDLAFPCFAQVKYDGVRCIIDPAAGPITREGLVFPNPRLIEALRPDRLGGLDGELIAPGGFEAAQSAFMGSGPLPAGWRFMAFDTAGSAAPFPERVGNLRRRVERAACEAVEVAPTWRVETAFQAEAAFARGLAEGGEGAIFRADGWAYREGKGSLHRRDLLKVKASGETEAEIIEARQREDDPAAIGSVRVIWRGRAFSVPAAMPRDQARALWTRRASLPGALASLRHCGLTGSGLPRGAVLIGLRRDVAPSAIPCG